MGYLKNFLVNKISQTIPLMAVFTLPCQAKEAIGECISQVYTVSLTLVGIVAFVQIVYGGFLLLTAAGNTNKSGEAMNKIKNAILGIVLLFSSYLILNTINPDLVNFKDVLPEITKKEELAKRHDLPTEIENFDVNPKLAGLNTNLNFTVKIYGRTPGIDEVCSGEDTLNRSILLKKPASTGTNSSVGIRINSSEFSISEFGDGKVVSKNFSQPLLQSLSSDPAITFPRNSVSSVEFYATLSCGTKELNRSAPVRVNISW